MPSLYVRVFLCVLLWSLFPTPSEAVVLRCEYVDETTGEIIDNPANNETEALPELTPTETLAPIQLSELYPAPITGQEEFIELYNPNAEAISIAGLKLTDASGKTFTISEGTVESTSVAGHSYLALPYSVTKIILNNGGDTIVLIDGAGTILDQTTYDAALSGFSWSRHLKITNLEQAWEFTSIITTGTANLFTAEDAEAIPAAQQATQTTPVGGPTTTPENNTAVTEVGTNETMVDTRQTSSKVQINEILPNAVGSDTNTEWIELVNTGSSAVRLIDWTVSDAAKTYPIGDVTLGAGELLLLESSVTKISLNNSGETVTLTDPFDAVIDAVTYGASIEGQSYSRFSDGFSWTATPTPGAANKLKKTSVVETKKSDSTDEKTTEGNSALKKVIAPAKTTALTNVKKVAATGAGQKTTIAAAKILGDGAEVIVSGVVTALPGQLGTQYFLLQDSSGGVQVYSYAKLFPDLKFGDRVTVSGEIGTARGTKRVKITQVSDIVVGGGGEALVPKSVDELDETVEGMLVQTSSVLAEKSGLNWSLENGVAVGVKASSGVSNKDFKEGDSVTVAGIVEQSGGSYRIAPRQADDVKSGTLAAENADAGGEKGAATAAVVEVNGTDGTASGSGVTTKKTSGNKAGGENDSTSTSGELVTNVKNHPWMTLGIIVIAVSGLLYVIRRNWTQLEQQDLMKRWMANPRIATLVESLKMKGWLPSNSEAGAVGTVSKNQLNNETALNFQRTTQPAIQVESASIKPFFEPGEPEVVDDAGVFYALSDQFRRGV